MTLYVNLCQEFIYIAVGRPNVNMKDLGRIKVIKQIASACNKRKCIWRHLGFELALNRSDLDIIQCNHGTCVVSCCTKMLEEWLQRQPNASWEELMEALQAVELDRVAQMVGNWLSPTERPSIASCTADANIGILKFS